MNPSMRKLVIGILWAISACSARGSGQTVEPAGIASISLPPELERVLRDYERAWQARDAGALAALFAEDGFVLSSTRPPVKGREGIRAAYAGAGGPLWLRALSYATGDDVGYIIGVYGHDENGPATGKFVLALVRQRAGPWLIAADIDNSNQPRSGE